MINANQFASATDNETLENAIRHRTADGIVVIPPRVSAVEPERDYWLLDKAVLLPENTTVILQNCTVKLSDACRDNFFRSANCGMGIDDPAPLQNIHLRGEGRCVLQGADHPRSTGDHSKVLKKPCPYEPEDICRLADWVPAERRQPDKLDFWDMHMHTYGTDAGKEGESQHGDWRNIGVLFANVSHFSIENITVREAHGWGISLEACSFGRVANIEFDACMSKVIDGLRHNIENQDGLNLRNGCHHITVTDITGHTGDDVVALTAIARAEGRPGGSVDSTHVMHEDWSRRESGIHDVIIRNVLAYSQLCLLVRLLPAGTQIRNVLIDGLVDTAPDEVNHWAALLLGEADSSYGVNRKDGLRNVIISNVLSQGDGVIVGGYLSDSVITNVTCCRPGRPVFTVQREDGLCNVTVSGLCEC